MRIVVVVLPNNQPCRKVEDPKKGINFKYWGTERMVTDFQMPRPGVLVALMNAKAAD